MEAMVSVVSVVDSIRKSGSVVDTETLCLLALLLNSGMFGYRLADLVSQCQTFFRGSRQLQFVPEVLSFRFDTRLKGLPQIYKGLNQDCLFIGRMDPRTLSTQRKEALGPLFTNEYQSLLIID